VVSSLQYHQATIVAFQVLLLERPPHGGVERQSRFEFGGNVVRLGEGTPGAVVAASAVSVINDLSVTARLRYSAGVGVRLASVPRGQDVIQFALPIGLLSTRCPAVPLDHPSSSSIFEES
jgi:hypothetical protein